MVEYLELFKGDDTDFSLNQAICIKLVTDYDLVGCTAHVKFYDYEQTFYPIVDKKLPLSFPASATSKFPLGRGSARIWLTEPDPEGSGTRRRTVGNDLKILVTNNIDLLSRKNISYTLLLRYNYNDLDSRPMLNGMTIEGDHDETYYKIKGAKPDSELSKTSENSVQNNVITMALEEKAVKVAEAVSGNFAGLDENGNPTDSGKKPSDFAPSSGIAKTALANDVQTSLGKADTSAQKVTGAVADNFAGLNSNGELIDSGKKASDFAPSSNIAKSALSTEVQTSLGKADTAIQDVSGKADKEVYGETLLTIPQSIANHTRDCVRRDDIIEINVDDPSGAWTVDADYTQPTMTSIPVFEYVQDRRTGKSGYVWVMTGTVGTTSYVWYGPKEENATVGDFETGVSGDPEFSASRIIRMKTRATQSNLISPNEKRLATMAAVRKEISSTVVDINKKKDKVDRGIYETVKEHWVFSNGPGEFLALANEVGASKPYYSSGVWMLPNYGNYTFETAGTFETNNNALVLNSYVYNNPKGGQFTVVVRRTSATSNDLIKIDDVDLMAKRLAKNMVKFAIQDLNPETSSVGELITALQSIYA